MQPTGGAAKADDGSARWGGRARATFNALVLLWLICLLLCARAIATDMAMPPVFIERAQDGGAPHVLGPRISGDRGRGLQQGDALLQWGKATLVGASERELSDVVARETPPDHVASVVVERAGARQTLSVTTGTFAVFWPRPLAAIVFLLTACLLVYRGPNTSLTRSIVAMLMSWAFVFVCTFAGSLLLVNTAAFVQMIAVGGTAVFGLRSALLFPHGVPPSSRLLRGLPWAFGILGPLDIERVEGNFIPTAIAHQAAFMLTLILLASHVGIAIVTYRGAGALERRKLKWIYWALWIASTFSALAAVAAVMSPDLSLAYYVALTSFVLIPLALLISITRFNLFDIDRILSATAWLSLLACAALGLLLSAAPALTHWASSALRLPAGLTNVVIGISLAAVSVALSRSLYPRLDAALFADRAAQQRDLAGLMRELSQSDSAEKALDLLAQGLSRALRPETLAVFVRSDGSWPLYCAHGAAVAPAIPDRSALLELLAHEPNLLCFELGNRASWPTLSTVDQSLLAALDTRVVLPIRLGQEVVAAVFLGAKGSGDVYVTSDLAMLGSLGQAISTRLQRLAEVRASDQQAELFQRYMPGPLVSQIVRGAPIEQGEREVTLMFVDIRGYSAYAEHRAPSEVFSTVTKYTQCVSEVVLQFQGTVVEFNGDGMMAVFGAPEALVDKEARAVRAAFEVCSRMRDVLPAAVSAGASCPVGVGISTGSAFVGSVRAADRHIWTALGASTNRAARLQALTRNLDTDVVIDEATWGHLGVVSREFTRHPNVLLRGHVRRLNLYSHTLSEPSIQAVARLAANA